VSCIREEEVHTAVGDPAHGDHGQCLQRDGNGVHIEATTLLVPVPVWAREPRGAPEAGSVDPGPAELDDTGSAGLALGGAGHDFVGEQDAVITRELLEAYWEEKSEGDDGEDLAASWNQRSVPMDAEGTGPQRT